MCVVVFIFFSMSTKSHFEFLFKTNGDGLLMWHGRLRDAKSDFLSVGIIGGFLNVRYKFVLKILNPMQESLTTTKSAITLHHTAYKMTFLLNILQRM